MAQICKEIDEWIEEQISKPVDEWVEKTEQVCKDWPWPLDWICKAVTTLVKIVTYVIEMVGRWVTRTVCTVVVAVVDLIVDIFTGLWDVIAGIFTLDWARILDGLGTIFGGIIGFVGTIIRVALLGDTIDFIIGEWKESELKAHIRKLLEEKYEGNTLDEIKDALSLEHGAFGFRLKADAVRTIFDSEFRSNPDLPPDLWRFHNAGSINLFVLCGFEFESYWNRSRHIALQKGLIVAGGGGLLSGSESFTISRKDLEDYINNQGNSKIQFFMVSMTESCLDTKLSIASEVGRDIGLILSWNKSKVEVNKLSHIINAGINGDATSDGQVQLLNEKLARTLKTINLNDAIHQLCKPVSVGVFRYIDFKLNGLSTPLFDSNCFECVDCDEKIMGLRGEEVSGTTFRDRRPDFVWKYVPIHELGHYFGLCHVGSGLDRIMYSPRGSGWFSWRLLYEYLYFSGRPSFILEEAKHVWNYIIKNFDADCLRQRHE